jgi:hypothetical protein
MADLDDILDSALDEYEVEETKAKTAAPIPVPNAAVTSPAADAPGSIPGFPFSSVPHDAGIYVAFGSWSPLVTSFNYSLFFTSRFSSRSANYAGPSQVCRGVADVDG